MSYKKRMEFKKEYNSIKNLFKIKGDPLKLHGCCFIHKDETTFIYVDRDLDQVIIYNAVIDNNPTGYLMLWNTRYPIEYKTISKSIYYAIFNYCFKGE